MEIKDFKILDACCGSRMFWYDKDHKDTIYQDIRIVSETLCDGRKLEIKPNYTGDFRRMDFPDESFYLVVFDPPHLRKVGKNSWLAKKFGSLNPNTWKEDIRNGFDECWRVLKPNGTLIFKWSEDQIKLKEILDLFPIRPLFGNKRSKTHWLVFFKS
ncbi:MAG: class I SAM-dependent methyltransferase [Tissierellia bacterium]|nr:class I SAM-dependent methyltransferase [Tissierellia bacterium]